jgi:hypothetical protein
MTPPRWRPKHLPIVIAVTDNGFGSVHDRIIDVQESLPCP